jgi:hypothetical protein
MPAMTGIASAILDPDWKSPGTSRAGLLGQAVTTPAERAAGSPSTRSPDGHVSVFATPDQIRGAIVPISDNNPLGELGLKPVESADGSGGAGNYRLPRR